MSEKHDRAPWLKGPAAKACDIPPQAPKRPYRLVLLGAPGVGKGTQAELISERLGSCHLSTGDIFRAAKNLKPCDRSPAIEDALGYMKRGDLVPDETVLNIVSERLMCLRCDGGFLLDGFPRTVTQAEALSQLMASENIQLNAVLSYHLPIDQIVSRLSGRRTCANCKAVFHVTTLPPKKEGVCDTCGGKLIVREDDRPEAIRVRMEAYERSTAPLAEYYRHKGLLRSIPAHGTPEEIYERTEAVLARKH